MAMEARTVKVSPSEENRMIKIFQGFGWVLKTSQEIYNQDSHLEGRGLMNNRIYSVIKTTNYVKLTFERDSSRLKYYQQLCQLENMFWSVQEPTMPRVTEKKKFIALYVLAVPFAGLACSCFDMGGVILGLIFLALAVYIVLWTHNQKMKTDVWRTAYKECWAKRNQIWRKAQAYLE